MAGFDIDTIKSIVLQITTNRQASFINVFRIYGASASDFSDFDKSKFLAVDVSSASSHELYSMLETANVSDTNLLLCHTATAFPVSFPPHIANRILSLALDTTSLESC